MERFVESKLAPAPVTEEQADRIAEFGQALSDPIRVRMLSMMSAGRGCRSLPKGVVPERDRGAGLCVCEFESYFGMAQSKVSYHMKKLKDAGLIREDKRGRWNYYFVDGTALGQLISSVHDLRPES
ncbi:MAG: ArsR/SmtB family transcription factor [Rubrobacter sp.]